MPAINIDGTSSDAITNIVGGRDDIIFEDAEGEETIKKPKKSVANVRADSKGVKKVNPRESNA